jgi:hypothetical protein
MLVARTKSDLSGGITFRYRTFSVNRILHVCCFLQNTQGLIFVVDSNDRERITEAQDELQKMVAALFRGESFNHDYF